MEKIYQAVLEGDLGTTVEEVQALLDVHGYPQRLWYTWIAYWKTSKDHGYNTPTCSRGQIY